MPKIAQERGNLLSHVTEKNLHERQFGVVTIIVSVFL